MSELDLQSPSRVKKEAALFSRPDMIFLSYT
jgi:hypothetical protein